MFKIVVMSGLQQSLPLPCSLLFAQSVDNHVTYLLIEWGGFYAVARVGSVRAKCCCPLVRMLRAAFTSLSSSAPQSQLCQRSASVFLRTVAQLEQT
jgi:hypothetical protein